MPSDTTVYNDDHHGELRALAAIRPVAHPEVNAFTKADENAVILSMSRHKAHGHDRKTDGFLVGVLALSVLKTSCLITGVFPLAWKAANVIAILKGNDKDELDSNVYHPISLFPVLGKVLEELVVDRLRAHLTHKSLPFVSQTIRLYAEEVCGRRDSCTPRYGARRIHQVCCPGLSRYSKTLSTTLGGHQS